MGSDSNHPSLFTFDCEHSVFSRSFCTKKAKIRESVKRNCFKKFVCLYLQVEFHHVDLAASDLGRDHVLFIAFPNEVLLNDAEELTDIRITFDHIFESLQSINLDQFLFQHLELLNLFTC